MGKETRRRQAPENRNVLEMEQGWLQYIWREEMKKLRMLVRFLMH